MNDDPSSLPDGLPPDIEAALMASLEPVPLERGRHDAIKSRLLARARAAGREAASPEVPGSPARQDTSAATASSASPASPASRTDLTTLRADEGDWRPFLPKVSMKVLRESGRSRTYLLKLQPGAILLPHEHPEDEECIVLDGEVRIGEVVARKGDYHLAPKGVDHGPIVSATGALLFLRGAVPAASQVKWASMGTIAALAPEPLRRFFSHW